MALSIVEEAGLTDVGRQRHTNEDRYFESAPLFAVADGMGGARAGEVASQIAVDEFAEQTDSGGSPEERLATIVKAANRKIYDLSQSNESHAGMGTTLTAALVHDQEVSLGHVGDSRAYRFRDDELERLTEDHSLVEELMRMGKLSPEEAESDPRRSIITRALGPEPDVEVETFTYPAKDGDVYLLCSDGLTGMLPEERMAEILRARSSLKQAAQALVDDANARGGKDNITVLLFKLAEEVKEGTDVESDTLSGSDDPEPAAAPEAAGGDTVVLGRDEVEAERAKAATATVAPPSPPEPQSPPPRRPEPPARPRKRRSKIVLAVALSLIVLIAACVGLYEASRQFYFVGTDKSGLITLYRGVPYDLPLGIRLYSTQYESTVPAISLPTRQRKAVLNNRLRGRGDAVDLVRSLERQQQG
ncbi:MAG TPA: Stp1/IreP family PP2C-type Ser/Thr phosphatase [Thermoleophilaceae bacterium]|nr:Stp1/IreP family PP2C-type Ser/Thr phosphatase [Thermoleophilaceae bacterium]